MKADLNADPTTEFVIIIMGEKKRTGHEWTWTCKCCGMFKNNTVFALVKVADPVLWWKTWSSAACPELTTVAMRVLSQLALLQVLS